MRKDEGQAVHAQTRNPARAFVKEADKHYLVVDLEGGQRYPDFVSPHGDLMGKLSPLRPDEPMYEDIGFNSTLCRNKNQTVLVCDKRDIAAEVQASAHESHQKAYGKIAVHANSDQYTVDPVSVQPTGRRTLTELEVTRERDPDTKY